MASRSILLGLLCVAILLCAAPAYAQGDYFNSGGGNSTATTDTQGIHGNPNCPPPPGFHPKNWSCKTGTQAVTRPPLKGRISNGPDPGGYTRGFLQGFADCLLGPFLAVGQDAGDQFNALQAFLRGDSAHAAEILRLKGERNRQRIQPIIQLLGAIDADLEDQSRAALAFLHGDYGGAADILHIKGERDRAALIAFGRSLPKTSGASPEMAGRRDGLYICNFWLIPQALGGIGPKKPPLGGGDPFEDFGGEAKGGGPLEDLPPEDLPPEMPQMSPYGSLTKLELGKLQKIAREFNEPIDVVGSAAKGTRRGLGTDFPLGKGSGTRSDLDIRIDGEADIRTHGAMSDAIYREFPKGQDVDRILNGPGYRDQPRITIKPDGSVVTSGDVPIRN